MGSVMAYLRCWLCPLVLAGVLAEGRGIADTPPRTPDARTAPAVREERDRLATPVGTPPGPSAGEQSTTPPRPLSLDLLKLPAGAVLVVCEQAREAVRLVPNMVVLTPQEYQKLLGQVEQLKRQLETDKPENPSSCKLTGQVEGDAVYLRAHFAFKTERAKSTVNLGFARAYPTAVTLDGNQASLQPGEEGFLLHVDTPGVHEAVLDLRLVVSRRGSKGADRMFELELPRSAITTLDQLDLPLAVQDVRVGNRPVRTVQVEPQRSRLERVPLAVRPITVAWKGPAAKPPKSTLVREAEGHILVRVDATHVLTEVELKLQVRSGEAADWGVRLPALPADAVLERVKTLPQDEPRIQAIDLPSDKHSSLLTIRLTEPSAEPLTVTLYIRQPRPSGTLPVGPFAVLDCFSQKGDIEIRAPDDLRLRCKVAGEVSQREAGDDQRGQNVLGFSYWSVARSVPPEQPPPPLLTLQIEAVKGAVETHVVQSFRLERDGEGSSRWQVSTRIEATPIRTAVDRLEVSLPADYEYDRAVGAVPAELVEDVVPDRSRHTAQVRLARKQNRPFVVTLAGSYPVQTGQEGAALELVRPLSWGVEHGVASEPQSTPVLDRGCQVNVALPEAVELVTRPFWRGADDKAREGSPSEVVLSPRPGNREYAWQGERTPLRLALLWRAHRPELPVESLVDVTLAGQQARVRQRLRYQFGSLAPSRLFVRIPPELQEAVKLVEGGVRDADEPRTPGEWAVNVPAGINKDHTLTLEYAFSLPNVAGRGAATGRNPRSRSKGFERAFTVPVVKAVQATRVETKVRIWCDPEEQPHLAGGSWAELPAEIVPERDTLPVLVLRGNHDGGPLLRLTERSALPFAAAVAERVLAHASLDEKGMQTYRVRFLLSKLSARHLDLQLPVLLSSSALDVRLDGKRVPLYFVDETGKKADLGKLLRLQVEPDLYRKPILLDVSYRVDPSLLEGNTVLQSTFQPPVLQGAILLGRARWQVDVPPGWLPMCPRGGAAIEQRWAWWGWLLAPRPALGSAELEEWLGGAESAAPAETGEPGLLCWQSTPGPLVLVQVPHRVWLLVCSLTVLALGLGLFLVPLSRYLFWTSIVVVAMTVAAIGVYSPAALPVIAYGCEPGLLVLVVAMAAQWMLHQRSRRRVVFMPGFTRLKTGSSLIRTSTNNRPRDPSTIDEPPRRPSSVVPGAQAGSSGP